MKRLFILLIFLLPLQLVARPFPIDFSRVGYMWGEKPIPDYPVSITLTSPGSEDATTLIQNALNEVPSGGAVLLKKGVYNIEGKLVIDRDSVVLRGEGLGTVLVATGKEKRSLVTIGKTTERQVNENSVITDRLTPAGQMWVRVDDPKGFSVGDRVAICLTPNKNWISALKMDKIAQNRDNRVKQWKSMSFVMRWERVVTKVKGNRVWMDNPVAMDLNAKYMRSAYLEHVTWDRTVGCGVENMCMVSEFDSTVVAVQKRRKAPDLEYLSDEEHAWLAVEVLAAEHCWIRDIQSQHFALGLAHMQEGAKNVTVRNCTCLDPISVLTGSRRYAFYFTGAELCLVDNCRATYDRHGFATSAKTPGPNVYVDCVMENAFSDVGPHHRWASAVLYDNCTTDGLLAVQDRAGYGTGHGWAGVNFVFWNCVAETIVCQSPWISGYNWCIGCTGQKLPGRRYLDGLVRPDGIWKSHGKRVSPESLYRSQLSSRSQKVTKILGL